MNMDEIIIIQITFNLKDESIREDGSLRLCEEKILTEKQVTIWVNSSESSCHNRPHVHASYADRKYSIAIDGTNDLLAPDKEDKFYRFIVKGFFKNNNMQLFREHWNNKTDSKMKFNVDQNGNYLPSYYMKKD